MEWARERWARWRTRRWVTDRTVVPADPLPSVPLRAVVTTWNEADIIGVTVANLLAQGCASVHLLDNNSDDGTPDIAAAAGAVVEAPVITDSFDLSSLHAHLHQVVERASADSGEAHLWWLYVDADELVEGPDGEPVLSVVRSLDRSHRVVGSRTINHYPRRDAPLEPGQDPRLVGTNAQERLGPSCRLGHWKHPLVRWDAAGPPLTVTHGYHVVDTSERVVEPQQAIVSHHYPYRARHVTVARLEKLRPRLREYQWAMARRQANVDAIYREAYDEVDPFDMVGPGQRFAPVPRGPVRSP